MRRKKKANSLFQQSLHLLIPNSERWHTTLRSWLFSSPITGPSTTTSSPHFRSRHFLLSQVFLDSLPETASHSSPLLGRPPLRPFALGAGTCLFTWTFPITSWRSGPAYFLLSLAVTCGWVMIDAQQIAAWSGKTEESERG